jgi:prepilin-type N-terminal cleavage/methylation domain-containing protein
MTGAGRRRDGGVTLLELIIVMVLIGILAAIIVVPVMTGARAWTEMSRQKEVVQQARIGLERLVRELRSIQRINGRPSLTTPFSATQIGFTTAAGETISYSWDGTPGSPLIRTDADGPDDAALNVQSFSLRYYEDSNAEHPQFRQEAESSDPPPVTCNGGGCAATPDLDASGGLLVQLDNGQPSIELKFSGTRIAWIGPRDSDLGSANVRIDKDPLPNPPEPPVFSGEVDQYASAAFPQQPLFVAPPPGGPPLDYGNYTLTITWQPGGDPVKVDAFELVVSRVVVELAVGEGDCTAASRDYFCTSLRDQVSFRRVE